MIKECRTPCAKKASQDLANICWDRKSDKSRASTITYFAEKEGQAIKLAIVGAKDADASALRSLKADSSQSLPP